MTLTICKTLNHLQCCCRDNIEGRDKYNKTTREGTVDWSWELGREGRINIIRQTSNLLLCDLPIYDDESNCDDYQRASFNDHNQEDDIFFEFFSHDFFVANSSYFGFDNIIFCSKLIPYKNQTIHKSNHRTILSGKKSSVSDTRSEPGGIKSFDPISLTNIPIPEYIKRPKRKWKLQKYELYIYQPLKIKSKIIFSLM
ncbi:uncharacterized protein E5676_scaffold98G001820 [Cucumis melo var. makuwa]|uniref:Uncharacterized protein n=1 Tax=Cucumis melo var. makuwa TaxID=1194695 RepID=A0A5D3C192_CUCMM|nr:uncharacterized protein E5676_scaffold98G001820 [Cucumis melo var. makuwa]